MAGADGRAPPQLALGGGAPAALQQFVDARELVGVQGHAVGGRAKDAPDLPELQGGQVHRLQDNKALRLQVPRPDGPLRTAQEDLRRRAQRVGAEAHGRLVAVRGQGLLLVRELVGLAAAEERVEGLLALGRLLLLLLLVVVVGRGRRVGRDGGLRRGGSVGDDWGDGGRDVLAGDGVLLGLALVAGAVRGEQGAGLGDVLDGRNLCWRARVVEVG